MNKGIYKWAVVGSGPAGIAAVGKLLDHKVAPEQILWIAPEFQVGDLGLLWRNVSSNTKVKYFTGFLLEASSFGYNKFASNYFLSQLDPEHTCTLNEVVEPLQEITKHLAQQVTTQKTMAHQLSLADRCWSLVTHLGIFQAESVILATGSVPSSLNYPGIDVLAFDTAIDRKKLEKSISLDKTYAVFGSSHSAIIILRHLVELGVKKVINFLSITLSLCYRYGRLDIIR